MEKNKSNNRNSNLELLKLIAMFLVVVFHVTQTLGTNFDYFDGYINQDVATNNVQLVCLAFFRYFGTLGNDIFFICSAWFLSCSARKTKWDKVSDMISDTWFLSVMLISVISVVFKSAISYVGGVTHTSVANSLFPITFNAYNMLYHVLCNLSVP